jgi:hypothetical protein
MFLFLDFDKVKVHPAEASKLEGKKGWTLAKEREGCGLLHDY